MKGSSTLSLKIFSDRISDLITDSDKPLREISKETTIPASSLSGYQNGKAEPQLSAIIKLANYFNVSVDWLLGRPGSIRSVNSDIQAAAKYTGLSQEALEVLMAINDGFESHFEKVALDHLIRSKYFLEFLLNLFYVENYSRQSKKTEEQRQISLNKQQSAKNLDEADAAFAKYQQANKSVENMELFEFQAQKTLFKIFAEIEGGKQNGQHPENN